MQDQPEIVFQPNRDAFADARQLTNFLAFDRFERRLDRPQQKRAHQPHALQRLAHNARFERFDINHDVGQLRPGRVIDLNEQTMRYFDPTFKLGLIQGVMVTPLVGDDWPTGPIE